MFPLEHSGPGKRLNPSAILAHSASGGQCNGGCGGMRKKRTTKKPINHSKKDASTPTRVHSDIRNKGRGEPKAWQSTRQASLWTAAGVRCGSCGYGSMHARCPLFVVPLFRTEGTPRIAALSATASRRRQQFPAPQDRISRLHAKHACLAASSILIFLLHLLAVGRVDHCPEALKIMKETTNKQKKKQHRN